MCALFLGSQFYDATVSSGKSSCKTWWGLLHISWNKHWSDSFTMSLNVCSSGGQKPHFLQRFSNASTRLRSVCDESSPSTGTVHQFSNDNGSEYFLHLYVCHLSHSCTLLKSLYLHYWLGCQGVVSEQWRDSPLHAAIFCSSNSCIRSYNNNEHTMNIYNKTIHPLYFITDSRCLQAHILYNIIQYIYNNKTVRKANNKIK